MTREQECVPLLASDTSLDIPLEIAPEDRERIKQTLFHALSKCIDELFSAG